MSLFHRHYGARYDESLIAADDIFGLDVMGAGRSSHTLSLLAPTCGKRHQYE